MCWHILALFYVVSVRYVFYLTSSSQSSCVFLICRSLYRDALLVLGRHCYINMFLFLLYMFSILKFNLSCTVLLIFVWVVEN